MLKSIGKKSQGKAKDADCYTDVWIWRALQTRGLYGSQTSHKGGGKANDPTRY